MKSRFIVLMLSAFLIVIGSACSTKESTTSSKSSNGIALSRTFSSTEDMAQKAMVILKGFVPQAYKVEKTELFVSYIYEVEVDKLYQNLTDQPIEPGHTIELHRIIGVHANNGEDIYPIADHGQIDIPEGDYLLFLNGGDDEQNNEWKWVPNTPNQLFKATDEDGTTYEDVFRSDELPSVTEDDVLDAI